MIIIAKNRAYTEDWNTRGSREWLLLFGLQNLATSKTLSNSMVLRVQCICGGKLIVSLSALDCGPGSSVGIATGYGLDGPGIESRWGRGFPHLSRPVLGSTQLPVQWVPDLS